MLSYLLLFDKAKQTRQKFATYYHREKPNLKSLS